jgi:hypothetical protein
LFKPDEMGGALVEAEELRWIEEEGGAAYDLWRHAVEGPVRSP